MDDPRKEGDHIGPVISEKQFNKIQTLIQNCLLYTSPSPRDLAQSRMPSSA